jgi:spore photoproduct lyase
MLLDLAPPAPKARAVVAPVPAPASAPAGPRLWAPKRVLVTRAALGWEHGRGVAERAVALGAEVVELASDRLPSLDGGGDARTIYREAKSTLAVVVASESKRRPKPIPPSADWRFDLAEGCPAHCQYCYLAGSLKGAPLTRVYANLPEILDGLAPCLGEGTVTSRQAARAAEGTTFEASCYTDPLGIEHLTGSLAEAIRHFGAWDVAPVQLRFTTKFDGVGPLLGLDHRRRTRARFSVNAAPLASRFEGGTARLPARLVAMRQLALAGYPVGLTVAPIMPVEGWRERYDALFADVAEALEGVADLDLTAELITHRFTPGSKEVLTGWYPGTSLEMDEARRSRKLTKFGSTKYVYPAAIMRELRGGLERLLADRLPAARVLYWT